MKWGLFGAVSAVILGVFSYGTSVAIYSVGVVNSSVDGSIEIQAHIDGRDQLILKGDTIQWHHFDYAAVGRQLGSNSPTLIGGIIGKNTGVWLPVWPSPPPDEIRFDAFSSALTKVWPSIPTDGAPWQVKKVFGRGEVIIVEQPSSDNDFTLIVEFDDNIFGGSAFYGIILSQAPNKVRVNIDI